MKVMMGIYIYNFQNERMSEKYVKENFMESIKGNFHDYISNLVFSLQKYVDMFYTTSSELRKQLTEEAINIYQEKLLAKEFDESAQEQEEGERE